MRLTLAIPVRDDREGLLRLLSRAGALGIAEHVVVVDDGSAEPLEAAPLCAAAGLPEAGLTLLRHDRPRGPGIARNRALRHVPTGHVMFLDADDLPAPELPALLRDLDGQRFDFCIFQHHDTRAEQERVWGQTRHDRALWRAAGTDLGALSVVSAAAAGFLARTANYPWNKIYRTAFLRENGIGCSEILVHEDVELHWRSFIAARDILASDRIGVIHFVRPRGHRLTNLTGPERLALFGPLEALAQEVSTPRGEGYALPFFAFVIGLFDWIRGNLDPAHHARFAAAVRAFVTTRIPPGLLARIAREDPRRTGRVLRQAGLDAVPGAPAREDASEGVPTGGAAGGGSAGGRPREKQTVA